MLVKELAEKLGTSVEETIKLLKEVDVIAKNENSKVEDEAAQTLLDLSQELEEEQIDQNNPETAVSVEDKKSNSSKRASKKVKEVAVEPKEDPAEEIKQAEEAVVPAEPVVKQKKSKKDDVEEEVELRLVEIKEKSITIRDLAEKLDVKVSELIIAGLQKGFMLNMNQEIDIGLASDLAQDFNVLIDHEIVKAADVQAISTVDEIIENAEDLFERPPVVTIMGHVDHGKTRLLDTIRKTNVMASEAGGITQHIGAYQVTTKGKKITFIDTPGHAAFTKLRARGAQVTDIVIIIVAADDGVMPQTIEAIDHAKAAGVPIIVAINKIDKPDSNVDRAKQQLVEHDLVPEDWGGKTIVMPISAKDGTGVDELLNMILLVNEVLELKANPSKKATGIVLEANLSKSRGPVATVLIKSGTLRTGDPFVVGNTFGKVRAMFNDLGKKINEAPPAFPVEVLGISEPPHAGDILEVISDDRMAKAISDDRKISEKQTRYRKPISLEDFSKEVKEHTTEQNLNVILKGDARGSLEAITSSLQKIKEKNMGVQILHQATGIVNESDVMLALASQAVIIAFGVGVNAEAEKLAEAEKVSISKYNIIYNLIDDVEDALVGMLDPEYEEVEVGKIEVRALFKSSRAGTIAGCFVTEGKATRGNIVNVMRGKNIVYTGKLDTLKRFKEDVKDVKQSYECGISLDGFNDFEEADMIVVSEIRLKPRQKKKRS